MQRLLDLLREQRREADVRSVERRGSQAWIASSRRLDALNKLIMRSFLEPEVAAGPATGVTPAAPASRSRPGGPLLPRH
jgi:hypothetical protein